MLAISALVFGVAFFAVVGSTTAFVRFNYPPAAWPTAIAAMTIAFGIGQTLGPIVVGAITDAMGSLSYALNVSAAMLAIGAVASAFQRKLANLARLRCRADANDADDESATPRPHTAAFLTGLLGAPIAHSASPAMHERAAETLGLHCHYQLIEVAGAGREELKAAARRRSGGWVLPASTSPFPTRKPCSICSTNYRRAPP